MSTTGEYLKAQRERLGIKQKDVADAIGVSSAYLNKVEKSDSIPTPGMLEKIADTLKLDFVDLYLQTLEEKNLPDRLMDELRNYRNLRLLLEPGKPLERFQSYIRQLSDDHVDRILLILESISLMLKQSAAGDSLTKKFAQPDLSGTPENH